MTAPARSATRCTAATSSPVRSPPGRCESWGHRGKGRWISVYANSGHAYAVIAGLRWDTSMTPGQRPRLEQADALFRRLRRPPPERLLAAAAQEMADRPGQPPSFRAFRRAGDGSYTVVPGLPGRI